MPGAAGTGSPSPAGIALLCDTEGRILKLIGDQLGLAEPFHAGCLFESCLAPGSVAKGLSFLQQIRSHQAAFEWELQIAAQNGREIMLSFDGCTVDDGLLVMGAASSQELLGFLDDLMSLQNDQVNLTRFALKEMLLKQSSAGRFQHEIYNDLTRLNNELANAHRELAKQNFELERLNRLKTQFLGMAAHDLRSPAGNILSCSDFLLEEAASVLNAEQLEFLSIIRSTSESMLHLIDDFLDVSAIESGRLRLDRRPSDPRQLLARTVALNAVLAQKKGIQVALEIEGVLPELSLDEGKIAQVLNNLISNAVKFSQPGTRVAVRAAAADGGMRIEVRDQGPGIPEEERGKLFQPFGRTSVRSTAGESSTGLGLAIVRKIVEGHGGRIWVESRVGVGSAFLFTLPAGSPPVVAAAAGLLA
jgi:two-component system, OmpR family, sensor kinase